MYLRAVAVHADRAIAERYKGGFVQKFHRDTCCILIPLFSRNALISLILSRSVIANLCGNFRCATACLNIGSA